MAPLDPGILILSALLLSVERISYALIWNNPATFREWAADPAVAAIGGPVKLVRLLFVLFKAIQAGVFALWIYVHGDGGLQPTHSQAAMMLGAMLGICGQILNVSVFVRLGARGVFYADRFGYETPWVRGFPFSLVSHPQYVGTAMTIWGLFMVMRFPHPDWAVLPLLETIYYIAGSHVERNRI